MASQGKNGKHLEGVGTTGKELSHLQHNQLLLNIHCIFSAHILYWGAVLGKHQYIQSLI